MLRFLIHAVLGLFALVLIIVGIAAGYIWHVGNEAIVRADKGGWFEPAASDEPPSVFDQTMQKAFFSKASDKRPALCGLFSSFSGAGSRPHGSLVAAQLANDIDWAEFKHERTLESHLRRWSLGCHLQGSFSDLKLLRMHLQRARFNGKIIGADEAARLLFGKPAADLDLEETIKLAARYQSPEMLSKPSEWDKRADYVRSLLNR